MCFVLFNGVLLSNNEYTLLLLLFYNQGSVHREIYANNCQTRCNYIQFIYICKPLYMFRVVSPRIIRSSSLYPQHPTLVKP